MGYNFMTHICVYGKRKNLLNFYHDLRGIKNAFFDFNKIIPLLNDNKRFAHKEMIDDFASSYKRWGCEPYDGSNIEFEDSLEYLYYNFFTEHTDIPVELYFFLIEKYDNLVFNINSRDLVESWGYILNGFFGYYTEFNFETSYHIKLGNEEELHFYYVHDKLRNEAKILDAKVYDMSKIECIANSNPINEHDYDTSYFFFLDKPDKDKLTKKIIIEDRKPTVPNDGPEFKKGFGKIVDDCLEKFTRNEIDQDSLLYKKIIGLF